MNMQRKLRSQGPNEPQLAKDKKGSQRGFYECVCSKSWPGNELVCCSVERKSSQKMEVRKQKYQMTFLFLLFFLRGSAAASMLSEKRERIGLNA